MKILIAKSQFYFAVNYQLGNIWFHQLFYIRTPHLNGDYCETNLFKLYRWSTITTGL